MSYKIFCFVKRHSTFSNIKFITGGTRKCIKNESKMKFVANKSLLEYKDRRSKCVLIPFL